MRRAHQTVGTMKAAMQAAMELEGRLEVLENTFQAFQEHIGAFQEKAALRTEFEALEEREKTARQELLVAVAKKADLEQLGQCLQAVRHELGEVVKRKANSELVESSIKDLRQEFVHMMDDQRGQTEALRSEVTVELQSKAGGWELGQQVQALQALADEAARRSDLDRLEQFIEGELPVLLHRKANTEDVQRLEGAHARLAEVVQGKAGLDDVKAMQQAAGRKADAEQLAQSIQALRQEVLCSLQCKANADYLEQRLQAAQDAQQQISDALQVKATQADLAQVDQRVQSLQDNLVQVDQRVVQVDQQVQGVPELGQKLEDLTVSKADREKVVEIVEAVRDEVVEMLKRRPDFEEQFSSSLEELSAQLKSKADEGRTDQRLKMMHSDMVSMGVDKADVSLVTDRIAGLEQALTDQVSEGIRQAQDELHLLIGRKVDMELMDRRLDSIQREVTEALKSRKFRVSSKDAAEAGGRRMSKDSQLTADEDATSVGTTCPGSGDSDSGTMCDVEEWMDFRMKLVKIELTKLVDRKADADQVDRSMMAMRKEVTDHVDHRVQAAQQTLAEHADRQAQAVRKELKADVTLLTRCMSQVEQTFEAMQSDNKDKTLPIKSFHEALGMLQSNSPAKVEPQPLPKEERTPPRPERLSTTMPARAARVQEPYSPDDMRTRRVRNLLTQLAN